MNVSNVVNAVSNECMKENTDIYQTWGSKVGSGTLCCSGFLQFRNSGFTLSFSHFFLLANECSTASKLASGCSPTITKCSKSDVGSLFCTQSYSNTHTDLLQQNDKFTFLINKCMVHKRHLLKVSSIMHHC